MPVANLMLCSDCGREIVINGPAAHRCDHCGEICFPDESDALRPAVGLATGILLAAPIWLLLAGAIAWWYR